MAAQKGSLVLLKIGDGGSPSETFTTIAGLRTTRFVLNNQLVDATNKDSGAWRALLAGAGVRNVSVTGSGIFTSAASEAAARTNAFAATVNNYKLTFGNGDSLAGPFHITSYERAGDYDGEETYSLTLESAGAITYTAV